jgi:hypothetical protein
VTYTVTLADPDAEYTPEQKIKDFCTIVGSQFSVSDDTARAFLRAAAWDVIRAAEAYKRLR